MQLQLNGKYLTVKEELSIIQLCNRYSLEIPRFCYHEQLSIAGNCRMCLVEVKNVMKPVASCAMPISEGMSIFTNTLMVKKAREGVMEFLLINHPLDCPICDQGGECDLQDQSLVFGNDRGRFYESKRAVSNKNLGPLVKTIMTRCIHCTRCVRFLEEVGGVDSFGVTGRGNSMEIGSYISKNLSTEMSGNIIDLCPVGALTSKPYSFKTRPWELEKTFSLDLFDSFGSNIALYTRGSSLLRVLPLFNNELNETWITDKVRFSYDGLLSQRLVTPYSRYNGSLIPVSWEKSFSIFLRKLFVNNLSIFSIAGPLVDLESLFLSRSLNLRQGQGSFLSNEVSSSLSTDFTVNSGSLKAVPSFIDFCLLVGINLRFESPLILVKLRSLYKKFRFNLVSFGVSVNYGLNFFVKSGGVSLLNFLRFCEGQHSACVLAYKSKNIVSYTSISGINGYHVDFFSSIFSYLKNTIFTNSDVFSTNFIFSSSSLGSMVELGTFGKNSKLYNSLVLNLGSDDFLLSKNNLFFVYQGHHGDLGAENADIIFPGVTFVEKDGIYVNYLGLAQEASFSVTPPTGSRVDWHILNSLYLYLYKFSLVSFNSIKDLRKFISLELPYNSSKVFYNYYFKNYKSYYNIKNYIFNSFISDYYQTNSISRSSSIMSLCSKNAKRVLSNFKMFL